MKQNGFSLIELLAVIAVLAIVAVIVTPIVIKTLSNARQQAFLDDAITLKKAADNYYLEKDLKSQQMIPLLVTYNNRKASYCNDRPVLEYRGKNPYSGNIYINNDGSIEMRIFDKAANRCAVKNRNESEPHLEKININDCKLTNKSC